MRSEVAAYYAIPCVKGEITRADDIPGRVRFEVNCPYCGQTHSHTGRIDPDDGFAWLHYPPCGGGGYAVHLRKERRL